MPFIQWQPDFATGINQIDSQHQKLVGMVNDLYEAMSRGEGKDALGRVLAGLVDYTKSHFATEERLMTQHGYPGYPAHKAEHDKLTAQVLDLEAKLKAGKAVMTVQVATFLKDWLANHILHTDKQYGPFLLGRGVR